MSKYCRYERSTSALKYNRIVWPKKSRLLRPGDDSCNRSTDSEMGSVHACKNMNKHQPQWFMISFYKQLMCMRFFLHKTCRFIYVYKSRFGEMGRKEAILNYLVAGFIF